MDESSDFEIWKYSLEHAFILISKDADFLHLANRQGDQGRLLWVRIRNCRKSELLRNFEMQLPGIVRVFDEGLPVVEIR